MTADTKSLVKSIIKDMQLDDKAYTVASVASAISKAKNALISPIAYASDKALTDRDQYAKRPLLKDIYARYQVQCKHANAMDFDDILYYTNILLRDNPDVLKKYQDFFQYILVDEYQDTNFAQHMIVTQLCRVCRKLCVVGDDAQSIYSFRGANIDNILQLNRIYPDLKIFKLEQNYRSTQNILDAANSLIEKNTRQIPKHIFCENARGERIPVIEAYSDFEEGYIVANKIIELKTREGGSYGDFAILYRTNAQSRTLEESLRKRNIPYRIYGGVSFYQRKEIKDALGYFRLSVNPDDDEALRRVINYPKRGIGETTVKKLRDAALQHNCSIWSVLQNPVLVQSIVNSGTLKKLNDFSEIIQSFIDDNAAGHDACKLVTDIFRKTRLITSLVSENTPENISKQENLNELLAAASQFVEERKEAGSDAMMLIDFLSEISLATDQDSDDDEDKPRVTMMTVHASKGLEFRNVIIVGVEDELFPSIRNAEQLSEIEEERRLLYVAITRAQQHCIMTYARSRFLNGQSRPAQCSRFIKDINPAVLKISATSSPAGDYFGSSSKTNSRDLWGSPNSVAFRFKRVNRPLIKETSQPERGVENVSEHDAGELKPGMSIKHNRFGKGTVMEIDSSMGDTKITVDFDNVGRKTLLLKYAKFTIL